MPKRALQKQLRRFDYKLVDEKLAGLLLNVDRDLQRRVGLAEITQSTEHSRCFALLNVMFRFARNQFYAMQYLVAETPEDPNRKSGYALVLPVVNRQLLDLLFSLVYMLDDFETRSLQYQRAGWREASEEFQKFKVEYSADPEWSAFFKSSKKTLDDMVVRFRISAKEVRNPKLIPYWKHPFELKDEITKSRKFLRWLDKWLYGDTSAQAHMSFGGLIMVSPFLVADIIKGEAQQTVENRLVHQYKFLHFSRAAVVTLAIATEIDNYCNLGNCRVISYLWTMFAEHAPEAELMYKQRYQPMLASYGTDLISRVRGSLAGSSLVEARQREHRIEDELRDRKFAAHARGSSRF